MTSVIYGRLRSRPCSATRCSWATSTKIWWSYIGHFVNSPFYVYAYSFGELLALSLYRQAQTGGPAFAENYLDMLAAGGSLTPQELMAKVGINLDDPAFWQGGFEVLDGLITRFEQLWQEYSQAQ